MRRSIKEREFDDLDKKLISLLTRDGRMPAGQIAKLLKVSAPTVRSRIEGLLGSGVMRVSALLDAFKTRGLTTAIVGIRVEKHAQLDAKNEEIAALPQVQWSAIVTGRYDIIAEVAFTDGMLGLYRFIADDMRRIGGIQSSESFSVMRSTRKWILMPDGAQEAEEWV